jgi:hypothetical protein
MTRRPVSVAARDQDHRAEPCAVATTLLAASIEGGPIGALYERRWEGEVDSRSINATLTRDVLRCTTPELVRKAIWAHLRASHRLGTVRALAAAESAVGPRTIRCQGAQQAVTAFAPKIEAAAPPSRARLIDVLLATVAYHRVGNRPGRWEPRARKRRPKPGTRLRQPRATARLPQNRSKYY